MAKANKSLMAKMWQPILSKYQMPKCPECGTFMKIGEIKELETSDKKHLTGFDHAKITFILHCENTGCKDGIIKEVSYKLFNPETHKLVKLRKKKE